MSHSNGIIKAPVSLDNDVYQTLGISKTSKGYDLGYANQNTHKKTNVFSKRKPVRYSKPGTDGDAEWFKGDMGDNYGFNFSGGTVLVTGCIACKEGGSYE